MFHQVSCISEEISLKMYQQQEEKTYGPETDIILESSVQAVQDTK